MTDSIKYKDRRQQQDAEAREFMARANRERLERMRQGEQAAPPSSSTALANMPPQVQAQMRQHRKQRKPTVRMAAPNAGIQGPDANARMGRAKRGTRTNVSADTSSATQRIGEPRRKKHAGPQGSVHDGAVGGGNRRRKSSTKSNLDEGALPMSHHHRKRGSVSSNLGGGTRSAQPTSRRAGSMMTNIGAPAKPTRRPQPRETPVPGMTGLPGGVTVGESRPTRPRKTSQRQLPAQPAPEPVEQAPAPTTSWFGNAAVDIAPAPAPEPEPEPQVAAPAEPEEARSDAELRIGFVASEIGAGSIERDMLTMLAAVQDPEIEFYSLASLDPSFFAAHPEYQDVDGLRLVAGPDQAQALLSECDVVFTIGSMPPVPAFREPHVVPLDKLRHKLPPALDPRRLEATHGPEEVRESLGVPEGKKIVGFVGAITLSNDPLAIVDACKLLGDEYFPVFIGEGPAINALASHAMAVLGDDAFSFAGARVDIGNVMSVLDVLVVPSLHDVRGYSVVEAWGARVPVVCSDQVGLSKHSKAMWVVQVPEGLRGIKKLDAKHLSQGDAVKQYAENIAEAINGTSGDLRKRNLDNGHRNATQRYTLDAFAEKAKAILSKVSG